MSTCSQILIVVCDANFIKYDSPLFPAFSLIKKTLKLLSLMLCLEKNWQDCCQVGLPYFHMVADLNNFSYDLQVEGLRD